MSPSRKDISGSFDLFLVCLFSSAFIYCVLNTVLLSWFVNYALGKGLLSAFHLYSTCLITHTMSISIYAFNGENAFKFIIKYIENICFQLWRWRQSNKVEVRSEAEVNLLFFLMENLLSKWRKEVQYYSPYTIKKRHLFRPVTGSLLWVWKQKLKLWLVTQCTTFFPMNKLFLNPSPKLKHACIWAHWNTWVASLKCVI